MYEEQLQQLGLTKGESKVYESLLKLGPSTVGPVVKKSGVAYSNIYEILNRLLDKGLASFIIHEKTKYFQAIEPTRIRDYLEKQEQKVHKSKILFEKVLPELEKLKTFAGKKEEAEVFVGERGLLTAYETLLKGCNKYDNGAFFYVHDPTYYERSEKFYIRSWALVKKFEVKWCGISNKEFKTTRLAKKSPAFINQRYVSFPIPAIIDILKDKVLITTWREKPIGILIQSQEISENFMLYFNALWKIAKP